MVGHADLYRLVNDIMSAIKYHDEILGLIITPYVSPMGPGFALVDDSALPHVVRVWRQFLKDEGNDQNDLAPMLA